MIMTHIYREAVLCARTVHLQFVYVLHCIFHSRIFDNGCAYAHIVIIRVNQLSLSLNDDSIYSLISEKLTKVLVKLSLTRLNQ